MTTIFEHLLWARHSKYLTYMTKYNYYKLSPNNFLSQNKEIEASEGSVTYPRSLSS